MGGGPVSWHPLSGTVDDHQQDQQLLLYIEKLMEQEPLGLTEISEGRKDWECPCQEAPWYQEVGIYWPLGKLFLIWAS